MKVLVTGGAGFVGVNLARALIARGDSVVVFDNQCRGRCEYLDSLNAADELCVRQVELTDLHAFRQALAEVGGEAPFDAVWHLAANSDIPAGVADPDVDFNDTFMTTFNTLKLMREFGIPEIAFASSSAVYGDLGDQLLREDSGPLFPISNYGAMKLSSEAAISAAVESHLDRAYIFRFPNVVGVPATHGVILDFIRRLAERPDRLDVLGNGTQQKSYLHVEDLVDAMLFITDRSSAAINFYNVGAIDSGVTVRFIAEQVVAQVSPRAEIHFGSGDRGWVGDVPKFAYSTDKLVALGWKPKLTSEQAVLRAIHEISDQEGVPKWKR